MAIDFSSVKRALAGRSLVGFAELANPESVNAEHVAAAETENAAGAKLTTSKRGNKLPAGAGDLKLTTSKRGGTKLPAGAADLKLTTSKRGGNKLPAGAGGLKLTTSKRGGPKSWRGLIASVGC